MATAYPSSSTRFVDGQGCPLTIGSTRLATDLGDVTFRENSWLQMSQRHLKAWDLSSDLPGESLVQKEHGACLLKDQH